MLVHPFSRAKTHVEVFGIRNFQKFLCLCEFRSAFLNSKRSAANKPFSFQHWLSDIEMFAMITAAVVHDVEHTGTTNTFHMNTRCECDYLKKFFSLSFAENAF